MIKLSSLGDTPIVKIYMGDSVIYSKDVPPVEPKPIPEALYLLNFNGDVVDSAGTANMQWHNESQKATFVPANQGQALSFKGTATSILQDTIPTTPERDLGDNNFTIEFFARLSPESSGSTTPLAYGTARPLMNLSWWIGLTHEGFAYTQSRDGWGGNTQSAGGAIPTSVEPSEFVHYAVTKDSEGLVRVFVGGIKVGEKLLDKTFFRSSTLGLTVGALDYPSYPYNFMGDISGVRLTKGVVRYQEDFLPPTNIMEV